jgi:hypothetical protein
LSVTRRAIDGESKWQMLHRWTTIGPSAIQSCTLPFAQPAPVPHANAMTCGINRSFMKSWTTLPETYWPTIPSPSVSFANTGTY